MKRLLWIGFWHRYWYWYWYWDDSAYGNGPVNGQVLRHGSWYSRLVPPLAYSNIFFSFLELQGHQVHQLRGAGPHVPANGLP